MPDPEKTGNTEGRTVCIVEAIPQPWRSAIIQQQDKIEALSARIEELDAQVAAARNEALREAADSQPQQYRIYGADRTDRYALGYCGGVEAYRKAILALMKESTND